MYQLSPVQSATLEINLVTSELREIPVDLLYPGIWQQREHFCEDALTNLANSMLAAGTNVIPAVVCPRPEGGFSIISGERRWRAAQRIMLNSLKCMVAGYTYKQANFIAAVENLQREDLNPIEEAKSYLALQEQSDLSHEQIAKEIGKSRAHVSNYIRLLSLDIQVRDLLKKRKLTASQARPLCTLDHPSQQREIATKAVRLEWSVKRISAAVAELLNKPKPKVQFSDKDADIKRLEREVSEATGYPCVVKKSPKGQWQIGFLAGDNDQFMGLLERMGIETDASLVEESQLLKNGS